MKKYLPPLITTCIGLCVGFALCYLCLVIPHREDKLRASAPQHEKTTITITGDGNVYLAGDRLDVSQLVVRLKELGRKQPVIIRADRTTNYRRLVEVVNACKAGDISQISLATVTVPEPSWSLPPMQQLPFGAKMTEKLFRKIEEQHHGLEKGTNYAWSFVYGERSLVFRSVSWVLTTIPKTHAQPERIFIVAEIPFFIAYEVEPYVEDQISDWDEKEGVISHAA